MTMRKFSLAATVFFLFMASVASGQRRPVDWEKVQIKTLPLGGNVYMIQFIGPEGPGQIVGGNVGVYVDDDGIAMGDAGFAVMASQLRAAVKAISDKPIRYIINTHWHGDHAGGNTYFSKNTTIIVQDNARVRMLKGNVGNPNTTLGALPAITFGDEVTVHMANGDLHAVHFAGHTDTDTVIFFPGNKVVMTGDILGNMQVGHFPGFDADNDGTSGPQGPIAAADYILAHTPDDAKLIPGHGNLASKSDLAQFDAMMKGTLAAVQTAISQGKTPDQMKQEKILAKWDYPGADAYIDRLYKVLSQKSPSGQ
jgi:glyoxylase-like metal-dependent hydrolase (beta-lactamase superfamily II)